jgi:hypothetical protein
VPAYGCAVVAHANSHRAVTASQDVDVQLRARLVVAEAVHEAVKHIDQRDRTGRRDQMGLEHRRRDGRSVPCPVELAHRHLQAIAANERGDSAEDSAAGLIGTGGRGALKRSARAQLDRWGVEIQLLCALVGFQVAGEPFVPPTVSLRRGSEAARKP